MKTCLHKIFLMYPKQTTNISKGKKKSELTPTKLKLKSKIKELQQKIKRQTRKISSLKDIIENLKSNQLLKQAPAELLKDQFSGLTLEMLKSEMQNAKRKCRGYRCSEEVKNLL